MSDADRVCARLQDGHVIPAHPLALTADRTLDERRQRALTRYYLDAGAGGLAVGVHTTQFEVHHDEVGLYEPVLELAMEEVRAHDRDDVVTVAGIVGATEQATAEARLARSIGYDCGLVSLSAFPEAGIETLLEHVRAVARELPVMGFYLQPAVGGRHLPVDFWRRFVQIDGVVGIKVSPFDRYRTHDVFRAVADAGREDAIALYTGNDDNIVNDLLTRFPYGDGIQFDGGLLGQWAVWTRSAVSLFEEIERIRDSGDPIPGDLQRRGAALVDANAAIFDAANDFAGCIPGINEVLRRQGLLDGRRCLDPEETLSSGQDAEIDRVLAAYPDLQDDQFVADNLDRWLDTPP
jgi:dihydrodipicolinate synthase/N-acetylneuraminate lyase